MGMGGRATWAGHRAHTQEAGLDFLLRYHALETLNLGQGAPSFHLWWVMQIMEAVLQKKKEQEVT